MTTPRRSHWAWGWEGRVPTDRAARAGFAQVAAAGLGFAAPQHAEDPVPLEAIALPASRVPVPAKLADVLTSEHEPRVRATYGRSWPDIFRGMRGQFDAAPDVVARPRTEQDVERVLGWASEQSVAVIPRGGGTSVVGGVEAAIGDGYAGAVALELGGLSQVLEVDPVSRAARIQAGALGPDLNAQLAPHDLQLRHFPQSWEFSTLGGWIATRAGGHYATGATHIDDFVQSTRMITPSGTWQTRRLPASGAGPSADRLAIGSEGALGVITEAWVRVQPHPRWRGSATIAFAEWSAAVDAVRALAQSGLQPANCRLIDRREAALNFVPADGDHALVVGFESADHPVAASLHRALEIVAAHAGRVVDGPRLADRGEKAGDRGAAGAWKRAFVDAPYLQSTLATVGIIVDTFETAVTWDRFDALHQAVVAAVTDACHDISGAGSITCRFTHVYPDGPAPYYTWAMPAPAGDALAAWARVKRAASDALIEHGATITHHHAVGRTHMPWYERQRTPAFGDALAAARRALDPVGIMNPGVLVSPGSARS